MDKGTWTVKVGLAQMLKGGVIMDVVTPDHAKIAEDAGAVAVMALERVPADIRATGGVARMSDPAMILLDEPAAGLSVSTRFVPVQRAGVYVPGGLVAYLLFRWIWRAGVKRFSAVGA